MNRETRNYKEKTENAFWHAVFQKEASYAEEYFTKKDALLSVGCGPAGVERILLARGFDLTGLDVSGEALSCAPQEMRKFEGSAEEMPFPDRSFDGVIFIASLQFMKDPAKALKESARVLREGGSLMLMLLNPLSPFFLERSQRSDSHVSKIRHSDPVPLVEAAAMLFETKIDYRLGIGGKTIFETSDPSAASLVVVRGRKRD